MLPSPSTLPPLPAAEAAEESDPHFPLGLTPAEKQWSDLYPYVARRGYQLRSRYRPGWVGSWLQEGISTAELLLRPTWRYEYEDASPSPGRLTVMDATRISDGTPVALKLISMSAQINTPDSNELEILQYLSSPALDQDPRNHCIQMIDGFEVFTPSEMKQLSMQGFSNAYIVVFPFARKWTDIPFRLVWESLEFIRQILDGLAFLHEHNIAHRDIRSENIMMDATSQCFSGDYFLDAFVIATNPCDRIDTPVRYLFIDLGSSTKFDQCRLVRFRHGWHKDIPEIYELDNEGNRVPTRLYDPFKGDIFVLGMVLERYFGKACSLIHRSIPCLRPLFSLMLSNSPTDRPTASEALSLFCQYTKPIYASRIRSIMPVSDPCTLEDEDLDFITRWMALTVAYIWGWVDYLRLVYKILWRGHQLRITV
ncbi:kinase-like domain-containing protein [Lentinula raphanica]|nr:kinase-like domain-containing protein [Lentinula raphanica]